MRKNVFRAKGLTLLLTAALLVPQMSGVSADAKAKKPKLSTTKVSVTVGKTKKVTVKNAKKVTWKVTKKAAKIVKLTKKSKKGATIKGLKKGTAKISVQMKNGKKKVKKTITVKVSSAKKVVVTAEPAKTTNKPTNGPTNGPTKEPVKEPTATPTATSTTEPSVTPTATPTATPTEEPSAEPTATPTPMPLPDLGKNDVKVDLTKENEYGQNSVLEDTITYYEGNGVSYTSTGKASGGGVAYWTNADKSGIDLSKYKSIRIVASSDTANTPVVCELLKSNPANIWGGGIDVFDGYSEYSAITEAGKAQVFEFQISDDLAAALAEGTLAYGIRLKYNAYHTDGDDLPNCNFNIYSIILMGKDDVPEPTATPTATPTAEPTPTPGVASGSAAVVVTATGSAAGLDLEEGDTLDLNASVSTTGCAVTGDIAWTSSNEEVATVSASGTSATVTAVGEGTATIKATITTDTGIVTYGKYDVTVVASDLVLEGDDLGAGASYTYVPNGFAAYSSMGIFEIDKSKLSEGTTISIKYTAMEGDTDVKDTQGFNIGLKTGDKWNSPTINNYWGKTGGEANLTLTADDMKKIGADDKVYVHVGTATAGFKGTFTYLSVTAGEDSLVSELPQAVSYVESGLAQWAPTAKVMLPSDIDFNQYSKCQIEFTASDPAFEFHGIVGHKVNGKDVTDPQYGVTSEGHFDVNLSKVKQEKGTEPFVVINAGKKGYTGSVTITKITFVK